MSSPCHCPRPPAVITVTVRLFGGYVASFGLSASYTRIGGLSNSLEPAVLCNLPFAPLTTGYNLWIIPRLTGAYAENAPLRSGAIHCAGSPQACGEDADESIRRHTLIVIPGLKIPV